MPLTPLGHYNAYSDESCVTAHRYMVIGGVLCRAEVAEQFCAEFAAIKRPNNVRGSLMWKNVSKRRQPAYEALTRLFFQWNREHYIDFAALVIDCHQLNHHLHNEGDREKGHNKFMFQHFFRHCRAMGRNARFRCYPDYRDSRYSLETLQQILNDSARKLYGDGHKRYLELKYRRCREEPMLQISDVLAGAVSHAWNGKGLKNPDSPQTALSEMVRRYAGLRSLAEPSPASEHHFDIWQMRLKR